MKKLHKILAFTFILFLFACKENPPSISLIKSNIKNSYSLDYSNAYINGFVIPSMIKDKVDSFHISFNAKNFKGEQLYYKIYYQNESYMFPVSIDSSENNLASENFYGSWENITKEFLSVKNVKDNIINTSFRITGNPRNEPQFYGKNQHIQKTSKEEVEKKSKEIKNNVKWFNSIKQKAAENKINVEEQLMLDAKWILDNPKENELINNKWQRNPRVGSYSLLIVVTNEKGLNSIPDYIRNVSLLNEKKSYSNPYYFFLYGKGKSNPNIQFLLIKDFISIKANVPISNGIYIDKNKYKFINEDYFNNLVNNSDSLYQSATFQYHYSHQSDLASFMNIPLKKDFFNDGYSKLEYEKNSKIPRAKRVKTYFNNTDSPGKTFGVNVSENSLWFKNPGNARNEYKKESVGVKTRHGLTYGKYTFKVKMAKLLTSDLVWTGVTNALWLIHEDGDWNQRRICDTAGYMPFYGAGKTEKRIPQISYSEIDFEILKTAEIWPKTSYSDKKEREESPLNNDKVMITCTNWDMACLQPENFGVGLNQIHYNKIPYNIHRWDHFYSALTSKYPEKDDILFGGEYYYFQIEWKPTEIIWRVGPEKNNLHVVGYMNNKVTTIPNNQMLAVITQEFHFSEWWPKSPFKQENIPFPKEDLNGVLYSLEIE